jgi:uncharacterized protein (DUF952 family)
MQCYDPEAYSQSTLVGLLANAALVKAHATKDHDTLCAVRAQHLGAVANATLHLDAINTQAFVRMQKAQKVAEANAFEFRVQQQMALIAEDEDTTSARLEATRRMKAVEVPVQHVTKHSRALAPTAFMKAAEMPVHHVNEHTLDPVPAAPMCDEDDREFESMVKIWMAKIDRAKIEAERRTLAAVPLTESAPTLTSDEPASDGALPLGAQPAKAVIARSPSA